MSSIRVSPDSRHWHSCAVDEIGSGPSPCYPAVAAWSLLGGGGRAGPQDSTRRRRPCTMIASGHWLRRPRRTSHSPSRSRYKASSLSTSRLVTSARGHGRGTAEPRTREDSVGQPAAPDCAFPIDTSGRTCARSEDAMLVRPSSFPLPAPSTRRPIHVVRD
jgi:hypothetical protein